MGKEPASVDEQLPEMPFLMNVGLIVTCRCQVACPHCIIEAGPHRTEDMLLDEAMDWIGQIAHYRDHHIRVVSLTGGEPFYDLDRAQAMAECAESCGLLVSAVTNAYWASSKAEAVRVLRKLRAIRMLSFSTDIYHQEHIPFERIENAIAAARECDVPYTVGVCTENDQDEAYLAVIRQLERITDRKTILPAVTFPAGRALKRLGRLKYQTTPEPPLSACAAGSAPIIFPDGRVIACIGPVIDLRTPHPLMLGNLHSSSLEEILTKAETNPILHAIRLWGPRKLIAMAQEAGLGAHLPDQYIKDSVCNACYSLMVEPALVSYMQGLAEDAEFRRLIAYGRVYYMRETRMVELLGITS
jgi:MoaA/NifB/PqqE/SkfB family radical SAM enzyme